MSFDFHPRSWQFVATGIALVALAACTNDRMATVPQSTVGYAQRPTPEDSSRVYVSDEKNNLVAVFNGEGKRVNTINATGGLNYPQNLFADNDGGLWVANEGDHNVLFFPPGSSYPTAELFDGKNDPADITFCSDGTAFVANVFSTNGGGDITVYRKGARHPYRALKYEGSEFTGITCDRAGNVFATGVVGTFGSVVEFPNGSQTDATQLPISSAGNLGGIKVDPAGNLLVDDPAGRVTEYTEAGAPTGVSISTGGWYGIALDPSGTTLYGADAGSEQGTAVSFPGGTLRHTFRSGQFKAVIGIAWGPAR